MERVAQDHVLPPFHLEVLLHVLTDNLDLAVWSHTELVDDQVRIVAPEVLEEHRDFKANWALQVTLAVCGAEEVPRDVVVVTDLRPLQVVFLEMVAADVALRRVLTLSRSSRFCALMRFIGQFVRSSSTIAVSHSMSTFRNSVSALSPNFITVN